MLFRQIYKRNGWREGSICNVVDPLKRPQIVFCKDISRKTNSSRLCCASKGLDKLNMCTYVLGIAKDSCALSAGPTAQPRADDAAAPLVPCRLPCCPRVTQPCRSISRNKQGNSCEHSSALNTGSLSSPAAESKMRITIVWGGSCWDHLTPVFCQSHLQCCRVSCLLLPCCCCCWHPASSKPFPWDALRLLTAQLPRSASYQTAAPAPTSASPS